MGLTSYIRQLMPGYKDAVLSRLAAVESLGLLGMSVEQTAATDKADAIKRIKNLTSEVAAISDDEAEKILDGIFRLLRDAPVNINFKPQFMFEKENKTDGYTNSFEKKRAGGAPMEAGDIADTTRNKAEEKMFGYALKIPMNLDQGELDAVARINRLGDAQSNDFNGITRPRYASLNFAGLNDAFGAQWGRSHFVLKDHLKPNMSFLHSDSFDVVGGDKVTPAQAQGKMATYYNMSRLVCNMPNQFLYILLDRITGYLQPGMPLQSAKEKYGGWGDTAYIECQIHAELQFDRDFEAMNICTEEIFVQNKSKVAPVLDTNKVRQNIGKFASRNGLKLTYFD